jgi:hypothetical protein
MSDKDKIREQIQTLRDAAARYDWRQCEVSMFGLFTQLPLDDGMHIAINQLADHLPVFERDHPDIKWVRQWFEVVKPLKPGDIKHDFPFHSETRLYDEQGIATPGSSAFMDGITLMQEAFDTYLSGDNADLGLDLAKGVIGSSITARTFAYAAHTCPEAWEDARMLLGDIRITDEYSMEELQERNKWRGAYDRCTNDFQKDLWLALADQMQQALMG